MLRESFGLTDIGRSRQENEDAIAFDDRLGLYIVCDGMGGHESGELASTLACAAATEHVRRHRTMAKEVLRNGGDPQNALNIAKGAVLAAAARVYQAATNPKHRGMGTTLTLLLMLDRKAVLAHVGDSRLYLLRNGTLHLMTADHTGAADLVRSGALTTEQARRSPLSHVLTRAVGTAAEVPVDTLLFDLVPDDRFLLCSDGLTRYIFDRSELRATLSDHRRDVVVRTLVDRANSAGGLDNISAVVVDLVADDNDRTQPGRQSQVARRLAFIAHAFRDEHPHPGHLQRFLNVMTERAVDPQERLVVKGAPLRHMFIVDEGTLEVQNSDRVVELHRGACAGRRSLTRAGIAQGHLSATEPSKVLVLRRNDFWRVVWRHPLAGAQILGRLRATEAEEPI